MHTSLHRPMKSLSKLVKAFKSTPKAEGVSSSSQGPAEMSPKCVQGLRKAIKFVETNWDQADGIFSKAGSIEEIYAVDEFIQNNTLSESYLVTLSNKHSVTMAIKEILATYAPIIPANQYDHFMSPLADYAKLLDKIRFSNGGILDGVMRFMWKLVHLDRFNVDPSHLARNIGIFILRADKAELYSTNTTQGAQAHVKVFTSLIELFPDEESLKKSALELASRPPSSRTSKDLTGSAVPPPGPPVFSIQDRSVKINFVNPTNKPSQQMLRTDLSRYGEVINIGFKEKLAVVLFADALAAIKCAEDKDGRALTDCKIKYLGDKAVVLQMLATAMAMASVPAPAAVDEALSSPARSSNASARAPSQRSPSPTPEPATQPAHSPAVKEQDSVMAIDEGSFQRLQTDHHSNVTLGLADISAISANASISRIGPAALSAADQHARRPSVTTESEASDSSDAAANLQAMKFAMQAKSSGGSKTKSWQDEIEDAPPVHKGSQARKDSWVVKQPRQVASAAPAAFPTDSSTVEIPVAQEKEEIPAPAPAIVASYASAVVPGVAAATRPSAVLGNPSPHLSSIDSQHAPPDLRVEINPHAVPVSDLEGSSPRAEAAPGSGKKRHIRKIHVGSPTSQSSHPASPEAQQPGPDSDADSSYLEEQRSPQQVLALPLYVGAVDVAPSSMRVESSSPNEANRKPSSSNSSARSALLQLSQDSDDDNAAVAARAVGTVGTAGVGRRGTFPPTTTERPGTHANYDSARQSTLVQKHQPAAIPAPARAPEGSPVSPAGEPLMTYESWERLLSQPRAQYPRAETMAGSISDQFHGMLERLQVLEAQNAGYQEKVAAQTEQLQHQELLWQAQLIHLQMKNSYLQQSQSQLTQDVQTLRLDLSHKNALLATMETQQASLQEAARQAHGKAQRESLGVVLSQQKLIKTLEQHVQELKTQALQQARDLRELQEQYDQVVKDGLRYKGMAFEAGLAQQPETATTKDFPDRSPLGDDHEQPPIVAEPGLEALSAHSLPLLRQLAGSEVQSYLSTHPMHEERQVWAAKPRGSSPQIARHPSPSAAAGTQAMVGSASPDSYRGGFTDPRTQAQGLRHAQQIAPRWSSAEYKADIGRSLLSRDQQAAFYHAPGGPPAAPEETSVDAMRKFFVNVASTGRTNQEDLRREHERNMQALRSFSSSSAQPPAGKGSAWHNHRYV